MGVPTIGRAVEIAEWPTTRGAKDRPDGSGDLPLLGCQFHMAKSFELYIKIGEIC